MSFYFK